MCLYFFYSNFFTRWNLILFIISLAYLKPTEPQSLSDGRNTWLFIGSSLVVLFLLLLAVAFITLCFTKRNKSRMGLENRRQIFNHKNGNDNAAFIPETVKTRHEKTPTNYHTPTYINFREHPSNETLISGIPRPRSSSSSASITSSSLSLSPLMAVRSPPKRSLRSKGIANKTAPMHVHKKHLIDSDSSSEGVGHRSSQDTVCIENFDPGVVSPKSYLSMPSVKAFPRYVS